MIRDCDKIADAMLEAEPSELGGVGESAVAEHVRACEQCRILATTLLHGQHAIAGSLRELSPRRTADEALTLLEKSQRVPDLRLQHRIDRRWFTAAIPLLAAASLLLFLKTERGIVTEWRDPNPRPTPSFVAVDAGKGMGTAVVATARPGFTVVWLYASPR